MTLKLIKYKTTKEVLRGIIHITEFQNNLRKLTIWFQCSSHVPTPPYGLKGNECHPPLVKCGVQPEEKNMQGPQIKNNIYSHNMNIYNQTLKNI